ncbi:hypothetical protein HMPREF1219_01099 [Corynebacterium pyruviciproducens ATCC BAA-1742]|uniref:PPE family domain-containing protein n=1 Tax=Corynebacterium pyruviciproducens ATCC BAA-1742 TaxID=1125779 RepID=S2ZIA5_9CORY|nr:hypothetical protein HMPREF1219_01099 [Corynebacterium pyruviciproducens ATCC BAA-1742]
MSIVRIDIDQLFRASQMLQHIRKAPDTGHWRQIASSDLRAFTHVSGLDQVGAEHAAALDSGPASASAVTRGLLDVIGGLAHGMEETAKGFSAQEELFARGLDGLGTVGGGGRVSLPEAVVPVPVVVTPKTVVTPHSVSGLLGSYITTHTSAIGEAVDSWQDVSSSMREVTDQLRAVANDIMAANHGEVIDAIVDKIRKTSEATESFATNAQAMSHWAGRISLTHKLGIAEVVLINTTIMANPVPGARQLHEQLALLAYAKYGLPPLLLLAEPRVGSLLDTAVPPSEGGALEAELHDIATTARNDLEHHIEAIRSGKPDQALVRELQRVDAQASGPGAIQRGGASPTGTQSVDPVASPTGTAPMSGVTGAAAGARPSAGSYQPGPMVAPGPGAAGRRSSRGRSALRSRATAPSSVVAGGRRIARGKQAMRAVTGGSAVTGRGGGSVAPGGARPAPGARGAAAGRGFLPMGMAPGRRDTKSRTVKTVTTELELEANARAIVGEAPPMVPGTIGAWARDSSAGPTLNPRAGA